MLFLIIKKYFDIDYINSLIENYIHSLLSLGLIDDYKKIYIEYEKQLSIRFYLQYCEVTNTVFEHEKVQAYIKKDFNINDLLIYVSFINNQHINDIESIVSFLDNNQDFLYKNTFILYCYIKGIIKLNKNISQEILTYLEENKYLSIDSLLAFLEWQKYQNQKLDSKDLEKLFEFVNKENNFVPRIIDTMFFLQSIGNRAYLKIALDKEAIFEELVYQALTLCKIDRELNYNQFNTFVESIKNKTHFYFKIAQIYQNFNKLDKAFNYFYYEYEKNKDINVMFATLHIGLVLYIQSGEKYESKKQDDVFNNFLTKVHDLELQNLLFLLSYEISVKHDSKDILPIVNRCLLEKDTNKLSQELKIALSNFYLQTQFMFPNFQKIFLTENNICYEKDGITYIKDSYDILKENQVNYDFKSLSSDKFFIISNDINYKKSSLFHRIVGTFAFRVNNPNLVTFQMDVSKEDPLEDMMNLIKSQSMDTRDLFVRYSNGKEIGFYPLSKSNYSNYFTLIPYLLEHNEFNFNAGQINYKLPEVKKILTLSSIIFLNNLSLLEQILEEKIYIFKELCLIG